MVICLLPLRPFHTANQLGSAPHGGGDEGLRHKHGDKASMHTGQIFSIFLNQQNLKMTAISNKPRWAARKVIMPNGKLSLSMDVIRIKISRLRFDVIHFLAADYFVVFEGLVSRWLWGRFLRDFGIDFGRGCFEGWVSLWDILRYRKPDLLRLRCVDRETTKKGRLFMSLEL